jgi:hypothetical protein
LTQAVDMTGFTITSADGKQVFCFPPKYMLLAGDEVTVWCAPSQIDLDVDNLLQPYLFWTRASGALRSAPFFTLGEVNEVLLVDPLKVEVASLRVAEDGERKEFRVLHCVSRHPRTVSSRIDTRFCVGCLSPPEFQKRATRPSPDSGKVRDIGRDVYVFSRYWGVVSDKSLLEHFLSILLVPLLECFRALLIYVLLCTMHPLASPTEATYVLPPASEPLRLKTTAIILLMLACDVMARRLSLCIKSGLLVTIASFTSIVLDQLALIATYASLSCIYPALASTFDRLLLFELTVSLLNMVAVHTQFLERRAQWHPLFKQLTRLEYQFSALFCVCGVARQLLLSLLLLLLPSYPPAEPSISPTLLMSAMTHSRLATLVLVPLSTVAMGIDCVRAVAILLHLFHHSFHHETPLIPPSTLPPPELPSVPPSSTPMPSRHFHTPKRLVEIETPMTRGTLDKRVM